MSPEPVPSPAWRRGRYTITAGRVRDTGHDLYPPAGRVPVSDLLVGDAVREAESRVTQCARPKCFPLNIRTERHLT